MRFVELGCIVEGQGEEKAVPELIRRIALDHFGQSLFAHVRPVMRYQANGLVNAGGIENAVQVTARLLRRPGALLVLLDCDNGAPCRLGPALQARAQGARPDIPIGMVLACREYESWFLAAAESLRGVAGLPQDLATPEHPERPRDAKGWLGDRMSGGRYTPPIHQPQFTRAFDIGAAKERSHSFDKCCREVVRLLDALREV